MRTSGVEYNRRNVLTVDNLYALRLIDLVYSYAEIGPDADKLMLYDTMTIAKSSLYRIIQEIKDDYEENGITATFVEVGDTLRDGGAETELSIINKIRGALSKGHRPLEDYTEDALALTDDWPPKDS